jgi:hypothetical protein
LVFALFGYYLLPVMLMMIKHTHIEKLATLNSDTNQYGKLKVLNI